MKTIAIVGQIGAGKSRIRKVIESANSKRFDVRTIDLDSVAKSLRDTNESLKTNLFHEFGEQIEFPNYVMGKIFTNDVLYKKLMTIYAPFFYTYLVDYQATLVQHERYVNKEVVLVVEGAALIHDPVLLALFDQAIWVNTPVVECCRRVGDRNKYDDQQIGTLLYRTDPFIAKAWSEWMNRSNTYCIKSVDGCDTQTMLDWIFGTEEEEGVDSEVFLDLSSHRVAIYAGSFNPFHIGHLAVVEEARRTFDVVVILKCRNASKEVSETSKIDTSELPDRCIVMEWDKSFIAFLDTWIDEKTNVTIIRGIRNATDLQYEQDYIQHLKDAYWLEHDGQKELPPVMFVPVDSVYHHISSSSIRAIQPFNPEYANSLIV